MDRNLEPSGTLLVYYENRRLSKNVRMRNRSPAGVLTGGAAI